MEKLKPLALLLVAVLLAGVATWSGTTYLRQKENSLRAQLEAEKQPVEVLVASRDLVPGDRLDGSTLQIRQIPREFVPEGALYPNDYDYVKGLMVNEPVTYGKAVMRHLIRGVSGVGSFSELLEKGQRAITLETDYLNSVEGNIQTGDYIDLILVTEKQQGKPATFNHLLDKVLVLATGKKTISDIDMVDASGNRTEYEYRSITLGLKVKDIPRVLLANENGELRFLLRNPEDVSKGRYPDQLAEVSVQAVESFVGGQSDSGLLKIKGQLNESISPKRWHQSMVDNNRRYQKFQPGNTAPAPTDLSARNLLDHSDGPIVDNKQPRDAIRDNQTPVETALNADVVLGE